MSSVRSTAHNQSIQTSIAEVRVIFAKWLHSKIDSESVTAQVFISSRIYWKPVSNCSSSMTLSLSNLRNMNSLELRRLNGCGSWQAVAEVVKKTEHEGNASILVCGDIHGPLPRKYLFMRRNVEITLIPETEEIRDVWFERIRARIVPWRLLKERLKALVLHAGGAELGEIIGKMMIGYHVPADINSTQPKWEGIMSSIPEQIRNPEMVDRLAAHDTETLEIDATFAKLVQTAECVVNAAEFVGDVAKSLAGASSVFQCMALGAQVAAMNLEAKRGRTVLPLAFERCIVLLRTVLGSLVGIILHPLEAESLHEDFLFDVLKMTVETMTMVESQLARGRLRQLKYAKVVKHIEAAMELLEIKVVNAETISKICELRNKVSSEENESNRLSNDELNHAPPAISPFFVGRTKELEQLEKILSQHGSAAITQHGGAGKTELMIAFAEQAKREKQVPGGVFWVVVDGEEAEVIEALARLHDYLTGKVIGNEERKNPNIVVEGLKRALAKRMGRWLLCLDNADSKNINGLLSAVCGMTASPEKRKDGWILVTSRQGQPRVWDSMKGEQRLLLGCLSEEDAMIVLWRQVRMIRTDEADDKAVMDEIEKLGEENCNEYSAMKELCSRNWTHSLGGLPLALVQAGKFIGKYEYSFERYLELYENANEKYNLKSIMKNLENITPIRDEQRSILTTWQISVERLSAKAYKVLRAMAMLGAAPVSEPIVKLMLEKASDGIDSEETTFREVFMEELVFGSSLVYREEGNKFYSYGMHRLVRGFVLSNMERGTEVWNDTFNLALLSIHKRVEEVLEADDKGFDDLPDFYELHRSEHHLEFLQHTCSLIDHYSLPSGGHEIKNFSEMVQLMKFTSKLCHESYNWWEEKKVLESLRP